MNLNIASRNFSYEPDSGTLRWKETGKPAGGLKDGYIVVRFKGKNYYAHRLAWLLMTGDWPDDDIDHKDRNRSNNRFANLRKADASQNGSNCPARSHNKTGLKGVSKEKNRFRAQTTIGGRTRKIGSFLSAEEAHAAYVVEAKKAFGDFSRAA